VQITSKHVEVNFTRFETQPDGAAARVHEQRKDRPEEAYAFVMNEDGKPVPVRAV
jgi:hypothetical protein